MKTRKTRKIRRLARRTRRAGALIAQGASGCVNRPAIRCAPDETMADIDYDDKVSKLLSTYDADVELAEYDVIDKIDPEYIFHLQKPIKCRPERSQNTADETKGCKVQAEHFSLLIMDDGGVDLHDFKGWDTINIEAFLLEVRRLFMGVQHFVGAGYAHTDIKPTNIVLQLSPVMRLNYIDFGLMRPIADVEAPSPTALGLWANYPLEYQLIRRGVNPKMQLDQVMKYLEKVTLIRREMILHDWDEFKAYYDNVATGEHQRQRTGHKYRKILRPRPLLQPEIDAAQEMLAKIHHHIVIHFDSYQLGLTLVEITHRLRPRLTQPFFMKLFSLFQHMMHADLRRRINIDDASRQYDIILNTFIMNKPISAAAVEVVENLEAIPTSATNSPVYGDIQPLALDPPIQAEPEMPRGGRRRRRH